MDRIGLICGVSFYSATESLHHSSTIDLLRHPEAHTGIRDEVQTITGGSTEFIRAHINRMKYLRCVINECKFICSSIAQDGHPLTVYFLPTQRLYPQFPVNVRVAAKTTLMPSGGGGKSPVLVPKGTGVGNSVYHMHRLKSLDGDTKKMQTACVLKDGSGQSYRVSVGDCFTEAQGYV